MPDPRIEQIRADSPIYIHAIAEAIAEVSNGPNFPPSEPAVKENIAVNYALPELSYPIGAFLDSHHTSVEEVMLVANLAGRLVVYDVIDSKTYNLLEHLHPTIYEKAVGGLHSALDIATNLVLPAYMCAKYDAQTAEDLNSVAGVMSFDDCADIFVAEDFVQLNHDYTKTIQIAYSSSPFVERAEGVLRLGQHFDSPDFKSAFEEGFGPWPCLRVADVCHKLPNGRIVYTNQFAELIHAAIITANKVQAAGGNLPKAGSVGCPITYQADRILAQRKQESAQFETLHKDAIVIKAFLGLIAAQFRELHKDERPITAFEPFELHPQYA